MKKIAMMIFTVALLLIGTCVVRCTQSLFHQIKNKFVYNSQAGFSSSGEFAEEIWEAAKDGDEMRIGDLLKRSTPSDLLFQMSNV